MDPVAAAEAAVAIAGGGGVGVTAGGAALAATVARADPRAMAAGRAVDHPQPGPAAHLPVAAAKRHSRWPKSLSSLI